MYGLFSAIFKSSGSLRPQILTGRKHQHTFWLDACKQKKSRLFVAASTAKTPQAAFKSSSTISSLILNF